MEEQTETQEVTTVSSNVPEQVVKTTTKVMPPLVRTEHPQKTFEKKRAIFRTYQVIWYILAVIEILLGFRVALKALAANPTTGFVSFIYGVTNPLALPFQGIFRTSYTAGSVFEWSTLIAALVYAIIAYGLVYLMKLIKPVTPTEVEQTVDTP